MGATDLLHAVFDLDTLDTRFTTPSSTPYKPVSKSRHEVELRDVQANGCGDNSSSGSAELLEPLHPNGNGNGNAQSASDAQRKKTIANAEPSRWRTREFYFYYSAFITVVPLMCWIPYTVSRPSDPRYYKYELLLTPGWVPGRKFDNSDNQYRTFRNNLPAMAALLFFHPLVRKAYEAIVPLPKTKNLADAGEARLRQRAVFDAGFALVFLTALHGFSVFKILFLLWVNYGIAMALPRRLVPATTWLFNVGLLFANDLCAGYPYKDLANIFFATRTANGMLSPDNGIVVMAAWLDSWGGIMPRWHVLFNITVLRLISFNMDHYWAQGQGHVDIIEIDPSHLSERDRVNLAAPLRDFSFRNYLAYTIYAPLYLTGPILTFNDYIAQLRHRPASIETPRTIRYAIRFLLCLLAIELELHFDYVNAIGHAFPDWSSYTPAQLALLAYHNLHIIWLKLLLPWRLFRLWALVDGIDPPENMIRCPSDNFSILSFWRAWHRSFNKWSLRYIFIPLGGADFSSLPKAAKSVLTYGTVFTFVALWHDIKLRLLIWAWLIVLFILPEVVAVALFPRRWFRDRPLAWRIVCSIGGVGNVLMLMIANLVGFAVGWDGFVAMIKGVFEDFSGFMFFVSSCLAIFIGVQIMFEVRQSEARKGISLRC